jgi:hypothetical protein
MIATLSRANFVPITRVTPKPFVAVHKTVAPGKSAPLTPLGVFKHVM